MRNKLIFGTLGPRVQNKPITGARGPRVGNRTIMGNHGPRVANRSITGGSWAQGGEQAHYEGLVGLGWDTSSLWRIRGHSVEYAPNEGDYWA